MSERINNMFKHATIRWVALISLVFAIILVPFFVYETEIEQSTQSILRQLHDHPFWSWIFICFLLSTDIVLPVPSSLASTAGGVALGFWGGLTASWLGMNISCWIGYAIGRFGRKAFRNRYLSEGDIMKLDGLYRQWGRALIVLTRAVPVLAETTVLFAGMSRMDGKSFLLLSLLSNLGISAIYAWIGAFTTDSVSFLMSFAAALVLPGIALLIGRLFFNKS